MLGYVNQAHFLRFIDVQWNNEGTPYIDVNCISRLAVMVTSSVAKVFQSSIRIFISFSAGFAIVMYVTLQLSISHLAHYPHANATERL